MARERRILIVVNALENDAPTLLTLATLLHLKEQGWATAMVAWSRGGPMAQTLRSHHIPFAVLNEQKSLSAFSLCSWIRRFRPSVVQSVLARPALGVFFTRLICRGGQFQWLASDYGVHEWQERGPLLGTLMERMMPAVLSGTDAIHTVSEAAAADLRVRGLSPELIRIVPNGVNVERFSPRSKTEQCALVAEHFPEVDPMQVWPLIGSAGNLRTIKGFADFIDAMPLVLEKWPGARFLIWGNGPERGNLEQQISHLGIGHAVAFAGFDKALERRLPLLDVYVQPSRVESFGMAAAEAMACGVPTVVSNAGGLPGLANGGAAARVYQKGSPHSLGQTILELLSDKMAMQKLGANGRAYIVDNFAETRLFELLQNLYGELLERPQ